MTATRIVLVLIVSIAAVGPRLNAQRQQPARLIVTNYTGSVISLSAIVNGEAEGRGRIKPGISMPIVPVNQGDRFKAEWPGQSREKEVQLRYDQTYGGLQDTWTVP
jgi:hypothetical protein